ncbi:MAG: DUF58 domain-containing protein [Clostridiales bacterium]|nr:DUF58 domain-containing protein [Clostridiales bacterium]
MLKDILTNEYLSRLETLDMEVKKRLSSAPSAGVRKSSAKGSSLEFSDFREYTPGDDLRRVDWNGYARFGRLYTKLFNEERQAALNIILDGSASMRFYPEKWEYAKAFSASLAYIALNNADLVNIFTADGGKTDKCRVLSAKQAFPKAAAFLENEREGGRTELNKSVKTLAGERLGEGITFIISDFFSENGYDSAVKLLRSKKQSVNLVQILDKREISPDEKGNVRLIDSETDGTRELELTPELLNKYNKALEGFRNEMREFCIKNEAGFYAFDDGEPLLRCIGEVLM